MSELAVVKYVALTSDGWTSRVLDHYLTTTVSYIHAWELKTRVLSTKAVYTSQTGVAVSIEIDDVLNDFGVRDKVKKLKQMQTRLSLPEHRLLLDVKTRWNSSYLMVERFVEQYPALLASSADPELKMSMKTEK